MKGILAIGGVAEGMSRGINEGLRDYAAIQSIKGTQQEQAINEMRFRELQKQEKIRNTWVPVSSVAPQLDSFPELKDMFKGIAETGGYGIKEEGGMQFVQMGAVEHIRNMVSTNNELAKQMMSSTKLGYQNQIATLQKKLQSGELKGKDAVQAQEQLAKIMQSYTTLINTEEDFIKEMALKKAGKTPQETWGKPYSGPGGSLLQESSTGQVKSVVGREPKKGDGEGGLAIEKEVRMAVDKAYGAGDLAGLDPKIGTQVAYARTQAFDIYKNGYNGKEVSLPRAVEIAKRLTDKRFKLSRVEGKKYKTDVDVKTAFQKGELDRDTARIILMEKFGYTE